MCMYVHKFILIHIKRICYYISCHDNTCTCTHTCSSLGRIKSSEEYRIAGNFRGIQFSRFSRLTGKPRKLNPRNKSLNAHSRYSERPSTKITSRNLCILSVRENWIPRKFPAIRYAKDSELILYSLL